MVAHALLEERQGIAGVGVGSGHVDAGDGRVGAACLHGAHQERHDDGSCPHHCRGRDEQRPPAARRRTTRAGPLPVPRCPGTKLAKTHRELARPVPRLQRAQDGHGSRFCFVAERVIRLVREVARLVLCIEILQ